MSGDVISGISLAISLVTVIYLVGFWKGGVDTKLNTLWQVYVMDALHNRPELATHHSPLKITDQGVELIPDNLRRALSTWPPFCKLSNGAVPDGYEIVKCLTLPAIQVFADKNKLTMQESISLFGLYLKKLKEERDKSR